MKTFRSTGLMSLFVIGLAIFTFFEYHKAQREGSYAEGERAAFTLQMHEIDRIRITRASDTMEFVKEGESWRIIKPLEDHAEDAAILGLLHSLTTQRIRQFDAEDSSGPIQWADFGLDKPAATFELGFGRQSQSLSLSSKNAFDGSFFVRQEDKLLVGDTGLAQIRDRELASFRSRKIYRDKLPVNKVLIDLNGEVFSLVRNSEKNKGQWTIEPKPSFALDSTKIANWIEQLVDFKPAEIIQEAISEEDKRTYLLLKPSMKIKVNDEWELTIGQNRAEDVFLHNNKRPTLYRATVQGLSQIRVGADYFRDGQKAFEFPVERARTIEVRSDKVNASFIRGDKGWSANEKGVEVNEEALVQLMQSVRSLEAAEFPPPAKTGISAPQIIVKDEKGEILLSLAWGSEFKPTKPYNANQALKYAQTNLEKDIMGVSKTKLDALISDALLKKNPTSKKTAEKK